jgi:hypothetical protein
MYARSPQRGRLGELRRPWVHYREKVTRTYGRGEYDIALQRLSGLGITSQEGGLLSTGAGVGTSIATASALGAWAGPAGAAVGALVGVITSLFAASAARAKGAKEENTAINVYLPVWDQGMQAIFAAANNGTATPAECISALQTLMQQWWQAAAQFHGLPGVADASNGGSNCGAYTPGVTTACTPTGGPGCDSSCTAFCCIGCHDLMPSAAYAAYLFGLPQGGSLNVCTVYASKYGASQRAQYTVTYTPPAAGTAGAATESVLSAGDALATAVTGSAAAGTSTVAGIPTWLLVAGGVAALFFVR